MTSYWKSIIKRLPPVQSCERPLVVPALGRRCCWSTATGGICSLRLRRVNPWRGGLLMSDRAFLFLFGLFIVLASLAGMGWLFATGQAATFDGLFLFCSCAVIALSFGL